MKLTHIDEKGKANMVDVAGKPQQTRTALAEGFIHLQTETVALIRENQMKKGDVLTVSEIAGIQAAKKTSELIPLCHPIMLTKVAVKATLKENGVHISCRAKCIGQTGVEMEALTGVQVGLLTVYDMCKAVDKVMHMENVHLIEKIKK
ncbi:MAG: cyclic pyranopterin monophosphate synthase accessory protein [bacterium]|nr:MAG: cyclic pyranopterin monophosphate synthase accessory protein [bacterium]